MDQADTLVEGGHNLHCSALLLQNWNLGSCLVLMFADSVSFIQVSPRECCSIFCFLSIRWFLQSLHLHHDLQQWHMQCDRGRHGNDVVAQEFVIERGEKLLLYYCLFTEG